MTTDRELLELAAKAAGMDYLVWHPGSAPIVPAEHRPRECLIAGKICWNPLEDDGDALRLAATLKADVKYHDGGVSAYIKGCKQGHFEDIGDDIYAATLRAITRAAAEIGRNME